MSLYMESYLLTVGVFILLTWAIYIPFRCGQLYNGHIYAMAIGGYIAAFVAKDLGWPFWLAMIAAVIVGAILGFVPAIGFSKTTGIATAMASVALIFVVQSVIRNLEIFGASRGYSHIPFVNNLLPITYIIVLIVGIFIYRLEHSRTGRALEAMLIDPNLAAAMGVNVRWTSVFALTVSSIIGALAGAIFAFSMRTIRPESFGFYLLLNSWTMMFVGGRHTMWGALISVPILWGLPQWVPEQLRPYTGIMYGALLIIVLLFRPNGLITRELVHRIGNIFTSWRHRKLRSSTIMDRDS